MLKNKAFLAIPSLLALLLTSAPLAQAATPTPAEDPCNFAPKFERLRAIQADGSQNYIEAIRAQLALRKSILNSVIDCAIKDINDRKAKLSSLPEDVQSSKTQEEIAKDLEANADYYSQKRATISNLGIKGTQDLARDIANWRTYNYDPVAAREDALLLWNQNQSIFSKTDARFTQIKPIVLSLKLVSSDGIQSEFDDAQSKFEAAQKTNEAAKEAIDNGSPDAIALIHQSLAPLSDIYKKFLDLADKLGK